MTVLYVQEQGTHLHKKDLVLVVKRGKQVLQEVPLGKLEQVVLMGRGVQMSTALLVELIHRGVPVTLTNQEGNYHYATLTAGVSRFGQLRSLQMFFVHTPEKALALARSLIQAKIRNQQQLLAISGWASAPAALAQMKTALAGVAKATTIDAVRGYEGAAAAAYFGAWRIALPKAWRFGGRAFYPPLDPINALLSFGYTLLLHDVLTAVQVVGLDPYLGTFHVPEAGRPSLALDLMEEFRPLVIDRLVLEMIGKDHISHTRFERPKQNQEAVYLDDTGRSLFVKAYEGVMQSKMTLISGEQTLIRRVLLLQVQAVARVFRGEEVEYVHGYQL